jgi:hypothetical protein
MMLTIKAMLVYRKITAFEGIGKLTRDRRAHVTPSNICKAGGAQGPCFFFRDFNGSIEVYGDRSSGKGNDVCDS